MATKQKSGLYRARIKVGVDVEGSDIYKYVSAHSQRGLEDARRAAESRYITGEALREDRLLGEYAQQWFRVRKEPVLSPSSVESYLVALNKEILPAFGDRNLRSILPMDLQDFVNSFAGCSMSKITYIVASLKGIFASAIQDRIIEHDPTSGLVKPHAAPAAEKRIPAPHERARLEKVAREHPRGAYLALMYYTGCRPGEARGVMWSDVDFEKNRIRIERDIDYKDGGKVGSLKTPRSCRVVPMAPALRAILWKCRGLPGTFVATADKGGPLAKTVAERLWCELMLAADLCVPRQRPSHYGDLRDAWEPLFTPHALRHNFATMGKDNGIDPYTMMQLLGHVNITTTMNIYTHITEQQLEASATLVSKMFV